MDLMMTRESIMNVLFLQNRVTQSVWDAAADHDDLQLFNLEQIVDPGLSG